MFDPEEAVLIPNSILSVNLRSCLILIVGAAVVSLLAGLLGCELGDDVLACRRLRFGAYTVCFF